MTANRPVFIGYALATCVVLIVAGSLYPYTGWRPWSDWSAAFMVAPPPRYITRNDVGTNLLAYAPLGYLLALRFFQPGRRGPAIVLAGLSGVLLSLAMESMQVLLPGRIASNLDVLFNGLGALTGALLALHHNRWLSAGRTLYGWRHGWFREHGDATPGLWLLVLWVVSQFALVPQPGVGWPGIHLPPNGHRVTGGQPVDLPWFAVTLLELVVLGTFTACLLKPGRYVGAVFLELAGVFGLKLLVWVLLVKPKAMGGILSPETLAAFVVALWLLLLPAVSRHRRLVAVTLLAAIGVVRLIFLHSPFWPPDSPLNLIGMARHLAALWPWLALLYLLVGLRGRPIPYH